MYKGWRFSDLLSQIQDPELVQVVEAGFDHASAEVSPVQIHHGCRGGERSEVRDRGGGYVSGQGSGGAPDSSGLLFLGSAAVGDTDSWVMM